MQFATNDWERAGQVREIANGIFQNIKDDKKEEAVQNIVNFATLIHSKDVLSYATKENVKELESEIKLINIDLNAKIEKFESSLSAKIDKVEVNLIAKIAESQTSLIKWYVSLFLAQFTGITFLFLKLSNKI